MNSYVFIQILIADSVSGHKYICVYQKIILMKRKQRLAGSS